MTQYGKVCDIYGNISKLGRDLEKLSRSGKDEKQRENTIQKVAADQLPFGDELWSACVPEARTIKEYCEFTSPPDILLEDELSWPVKP